MRDWIVKKLFLLALRIEGATLLLFCYEYLEQMREPLLEALDEYRAEQKPKIGRPMGSKDKKPRKRKGDAA